MVNSTDRILKQSLAKLVNDLIWSNLISQLNLTFVGELFFYESHFSVKIVLKLLQVVLMGAGADEQMAGYSRHRQRFANGGWPALISEIEMEMNRIPQRNLGRDNRMIADHGRAPRLPYLDENVVNCLSQLPICAKVDLRLPLGVGDKIILRVLAFRLGLIRTATEPKRAIQFGSRIAKAEARKEKGHQCCDRLITNQ